MKVPKWHFCRPSPQECQIRCFRNEPHKRNDCISVPRKSRQLYQATGRKKAIKLEQSHGRLLKGIAIKERIDAFACFVKSGFRCRTHV